MRILARAALLAAPLSVAWAGGPAVTVRLHWLESRAPGGPKAQTVRLSMSEYVAAVLAGEVSGFPSEESRKAMAVAARTYAARFRGRHKAEGFDFCDTTHCQDLRIRAVTGSLRAAVEDTEGELLWYSGRPAATYYHQDCGGMTEDAAYVWPASKAPYLRQHPDAFCTSRGRFEWRAATGKQELGEALAASGVRVPPDLRGVTVQSRSPSGRVLLLRLAGGTHAVLSASTFAFAVGRALGWDRIRSDFYQVRDAGDRIVFEGFGAGHGVGLCQAGADRMGREGRSYRQILEYYYPGTALGLTAQGLRWQALAGERVELLTTRPGGESYLIGLAEGLMRAAEERTGLAFPSKPRLRVYPTVAAFRDATGEPGWVGASVRGREVRLQPATAFQKPGSPEDVLRHELQHLLIESYAAPSVPIWFREGLALHLSGEPATPVPTLDPATLDRMLRRPASQKELRQAYAGARARVAGLASRHGEASLIRWLRTGLPSGTGSARPAGPRGQNQPPRDR